MKAVILAGGFGTRLSEETGIKPKPLVEIGQWPLLWHIMKIYSAHGFNDFIVCCGYKGHLIKEYFANYLLRRSSITFDFASGETIYHHSSCEPWRVTLVDTGENTMTGGRLKRVKDYLGDETFFLTYGDGVGDVDLKQLLAFHRTQGALATVTAVQPPGRFGVFRLEKGQTRIHQFNEKPRSAGAEGWINGGFFVLEPRVLDYVDGDETIWEREPMEQLARDGELAAFQHPGFWHHVDTLREKMVLEELWASGNAPWKIW